MHKEHKMSVLKSSLALVKARPKSLYQIKGPSLHLGGSRGLSCSVLRGSGTGAALRVQFPKGINLTKMK